jgi:hypothetical protein
METCVFFWGTDWIIKYYLDKFRLQIDNTKESVFYLLDFAVRMWCHLGEFYAGIRDTAWCMYRATRL